MQEPRCQLCGCAYSSHNDKTGACRTRRAHWDDEIRGFTDEKLCGCPGYTGEVPIVVGDCGHEFLTKLDPCRCVHCHKHVPFAEQKRGVTR